jgi:thiol-disulfide isomerase/thioredoxin
MAQGLIRQTNAVGKPFDLTFTDAISGKEISLQKDLKGKVVVIDFWATWCGPCVGEMPKNKEIYSQYKDKGVEFIGVSLDQPAPEGLNALKTFIAKNEIPWPQYFEGKGWDSDFSAGWGINSIPTMFVIDKQGKLASVSARGQLETLIPKLLAAPMD